MARQKNIIKKRQKRVENFDSPKTKIIIAIYLMLGLLLLGVTLLAAIKPLFLTNMLGAVSLETIDLDLKNYPALFVSNGVFDGYLVVGEKAHAMDNLALTDIASSMKIMNAVKTTNITLSGDVWLVGDGSNNKLEMTNNDRSAGSIQGENLYDITSYIGKDELDALADGTYKTKDGSYTYKQYLYFDTTNTATNELVKYVENDNDIMDLFFFVESSKNIGQYRLEFSPSTKSSILDTAGSASSSGTVLDDFENTKINLFGIDYNIVLARRPDATPQNSIKLTLMGGAVSGSVLEGETQTYTFDGNTYNVNLVYVDSTYAKFTVNGEQTAKLQVGDTYKLADDKEIGVSEILYQSYAGGVHSADFFLGANKLELTDNLITDSLSDSEIVDSSETIDGAAVIITGTDDNSIFSLSTITIDMTAQDDYFVPVNGQLSDAIVDQGDEKELLFTNNWDLVFNGLDEVDSHDIKLDSSSDRRYKFVFYDGNNNQVDLPLFYAVDDTTISFSEGSAEKCVILKEGISISKEDYFVLTGGDASGGSAVSFGLQYKGADKSTTTSPKIKFKNLGSNEMLEYTIDTSSTAAGSAVCDIKIGGYTFSVLSKSDETSDDFNITLSGTDDIDIVDYYGAQVDLSNIPTDDCRSANAASSTLTITTADSSNYGDQTPSTIVLTVDATATNEVTVTSFTVGGTSNPLLGEGDIYEGYTSMGGKITYNSPSSSPHTFTYNYPKEQKLPLLYVTSGATTTSSTTSGDLTAVSIIDATKLDSEVAEISAQNLIAVGGPCVNSVAAELLGNPIDCTEGFTPEKAKIQLFKNGDNVAMLVAGYTNIETRLAGRFISHRSTELSGEEVDIEGADYNTATFSKIR